MGKNSPSFVLKKVFKDISNIENVIKDSKVIQQSYKQINFDDNKEVKKIIEDTKQLVTSLKDEAVKIDDYFKENYNHWEGELLKDVAVDESAINGKVNGNLDETNTEQPVTDQSNQDSHASEGTRESIGEKDRESEVAVANDDSRGDEGCNNDADKDVNTNDKDEECKKNSTTDDKQGGGDKNLESKKNPTSKKKKNKDACEKKQNEEGKNEDIDKRKNKNDACKKKKQNNEDKNESVIEDNDKTKNENDACKKKRSKKDENEGVLEDNDKSKNENDACKEKRNKEDTNESVTDDNDTSKNESDACKKKRSKEDTNESATEDNDKSKNKSDACKKKRSKEDTNESVTVDNDKSENERDACKKKRNKEVEDETVLENNVESSRNGNDEDGQEDVSDKRNEDDKENEDDSLKENTEPTKESEETIPEPKVFLKCVDISKLVSPHILPALRSSNSEKKNKRVSINDSILIISDSDTEETPQVKKTVKRVSFADDCKKSDDEKNSRKFKKEAYGNSSKRVPSNTPNVAKIRHAKKDLLKEIRLSDTSSGSDLSDTSSGSDLSDESSNSKSKNSHSKSKSPKKLKKQETPMLDVQTDKKFSCKAYVPIPRIACEKLKQIYLNNKEVSEIKRLTDLNSLEKSRKNKKKKMRDNSSSSDSENVKPKAKKARVSTNKNDSSGESSSDEEGPNNENNKMDTETIPPCTNEGTASNGLADDAVRMILDNVNSGSDKSENESDADDEDEDAKKDKSKKSSSDKKSKKSSKDKNKSESDDGSDSDAKKDKKSKSKKKKDSDKSDDGNDSDSKKNDSDSNDASDSDTKNEKKDKSKKRKDSDKSDDGSDSDTKKDKKKKKKDKKKKKKHSDESDDGSDSDTKKDKKSKNKKRKDSSEESGSDKEDDAKRKEKKKWRKDKLLTMTISDSDSEDEFVRFKKGSEKAKQDAKARMVKKKSKVVIDSDSGSDNNKEKKNDDAFKPSSSSSSSSSSDSSNSESDKEKEVKDTKKKSRIKRVKDSSSDEDNKSTRKTIRKVIGHDSLAETTKKAEKDERERKARIAERQKKYNQLFESDKPADATVDKVVLDFNEETEEEIIAVDQDLVKKLKPHQAKGVQFMWDACFESVERVKKTNGSGCILAHCMGLGKTLQVIALVHTLISNKKLTKIHRILVVCPVNTVLNWVSEFEKWLKDIDEPTIEVFDLVSSKQTYERKYQVEAWTQDGGVLIMGYDMFRNLTNPTNKRLRKTQREAFQKGLVNPGPDLVICDEGHLLKNEKSNLSIAMNRLHTLRRIVLTGTPMQNNLKEYYCMVQFVKPNLLGTYKEYLNRFVNPITNGQYTDSTDHDINIMRKRSHVLHKMLDGIVQRKDYSVLTPYLPPKHEYVLFLTLTETQIQVYQHYLTNYSRRPAADTKMRTSFLFVDFQEFQRIITHPRTLLLKSEEDQRKKLFEDDDEDSEGSLKNFIDDDSSSAKSTSSSDNASDNESGSDEKSKSKEKAKQKKGGPRLTRNSAAAQGIVVEEIERPVKEEWWSQFCSGDELDNIGLSCKLHLLFTILQECELIGDKLLVFSQSLYSLNIIEYFLAKIDEATQKGESEKVCGFSGSWATGLDYFRLDGSVSCDNRSASCQSFNNPDNPRARLFLISTRAGGLGINLVGANRVVIFDVSWNPSHDIQSIYRVYRFGQTKPCYVYRFVTNGTMEMKIYERQVTKQAISKRVIDEQQIDRHYNQNDLAELYKFDPKPDDQPTPLIPKDVLLAELLQKEKDKIFKYHEHQTLLENKEDEELDEAERKAAWEEYENEKTAKVNTINNTPGGWIKNLPVTSIHAALNSIVQKDQPSWSNQQVQSVIPMIIQQLREQVEKGDMLLFNRILSELKILQASQQQRIQEYYVQQQMRLLQQMRLVQQQQQQNSAAGGGAQGFDFENTIRSLLNSNQPQTDPTEVVELHD